MCVWVGKPLPPTHGAETWFFNAASAVFVLLFKSAGEQTLNRTYVLLSKYLRLDCIFPWHRGEN